MHQGVLGSLKLIFKFLTSCFFNNRRVLMYSFDNCTSVSGVFVYN